MGKIAIGCDHAGYELKLVLKKQLEQKGFEVFDHGCHSAERVDYPDFASLVAQDVSNQKVERAVLVCGSGIGMAIAANKIKGVRAASILTEEMSRLSRQHNDLNILCLGSRLLTPEQAQSILKVFLETRFEGGRHTGRVQKMMRL